MLDILPPWPLLTAFLAASFVLAISPGPGVLYIVARSLSQGRRSGLASMAGVALGNFANAIGAAIGLAALFSVSSMAFLAVKYAGALYLVFLGVKALRTRAAGALPGFAAPVKLVRIFRDGFVVALFNPKTALFFAAFLPQFMSSDAAPMLQSVTLGALFVGVAAVTDTLYALAAGSVAGNVVSGGGGLRLSRYAVGGTFIGLGLVAAVGGARSIQ